MDVPSPSSPILAVDGVVFQLEGGKLTVLVIQRTSEPFLGAWALPGVRILANETTKQALGRGLAKETGISINQINLVEQPYAFDAPERDPRHYVVAVMYVGLCKNVAPGKLNNSNAVQNPQFLPVAGLPKLAFDHDTIAKFAHNRLKALASSTNAIGSLMPRQFTLSELQAAYEAIFCKPLDKRNFRKKILSLGCIEDTGKMLKEGAHRPAKVYKFRRAGLNSIAQSFD